MAHESLSMVRDQFSTQHQLSDLQYIASQGFIGEEEKPTMMPMGPICM